MTNNQPTFTIGKVQQTVDLFFSGQQQEVTHTFLLQFQEHVESLVICFEGLNLPFQQISDAGRIFLGQTIHSLLSAALVKLAVQDDNGHLLHILLSFVLFLACSMDAQLASLDNNWRIPPLMCGQPLNISVLHSRETRIASIPAILSYAQEIYSSEMDNYKSTLDQDMIRQLNERAFKVFNDAFDSSLMSEGMVLENGGVGKLINALGSIIFEVLDYITTTSLDPQIRKIRKQRFDASNDCIGNIIAHLLSVVLNSEEHLGAEHNKQLQIAQNQKANTFANNGEYLTIFAELPSLMKLVHFYVSKMHSSSEIFALGIPSYVVYVFNHFFGQFIEHKSDPGVNMMDPRQATIVKFIQYFTLNPSFIEIIQETCSVSSEILQMPMQSGIQVQQDIRSFIRTIQIPLSMSIELLTASRSYIYSNLLSILQHKNKCEIMPNTNFTQVNDKLNEKEFICSSINVENIMQSLSSVINTIFLWNTSLLIDEPDISMLQGDNERFDKSNNTYNNQIIERSISPLIPWLRTLNTLMSSSAPNELINIPFKQISSIHHYPLPLYCLNDFVDILFALRGMFETAESESAGFIPHFESGRLKNQMKELLSENVDNSSNFFSIIQQTNETHDETERKQDLFELQSKYIIQIINSFFFDEIFPKILSHLVYVLQLQLAYDIQNQNNSNSLEKAESMEQQNDQYSNDDSMQEIELFIHDCEDCIHSCYLVIKNQSFFNLLNNFAVQTHSALMTGARELRIDPNTNAEQITNQLCMRSEWTQVTALFIIAQKALQDTSEIGLKLDNDEDDEDDEDDHKGEEFENECLNVSGEDLNIQYTKTISSHIEMMCKFIIAVGGIQTQLIQNQIQGENKQFLCLPFGVISSICSWIGSLPSNIMWNQSLLMTSQVIIPLLFACLQNSRNNSSPPISYLYSQFTPTIIQITPQSLSNVPPLIISQLQNNEQHFGAVSISSYSLYQGIESTLDDEILQGRSISQSDHLKKLQYRNVAFRASQAIYLLIKEVSANLLLNAQQLHQQQQKEKEEKVQFPSFIRSSQLIQQNISLLYDQQQQFNDISYDNQTNPSLSHLEDIFLSIALSLISTYPAIDICARSKVVEIISFILTTLTEKENMQNAEQIQIDQKKQNNGYNFLSVFKSLFDQTGQHFQAPCSISFNFGSNQSEQTSESNSQNMCLIITIEIPSPFSYYWLYLAIFDRILIQTEELYQKSNDGKSYDQRINLQENEQIYITALIFQHIISFTKPLNANLVSTPFLTEYQQNSNQDEFQVQGLNLLPKSILNFNIQQEDVRLLCKIHPLIWCFVLRWGSISELIKQAMQKTCQSFIHSSSLHSNSQNSFMSFSNTSDLLLKHYSQFIRQMHLSLHQHSLLILHPALSPSFLSTFIDFIHPNQDLITSPIKGEMIQQPLQGIPSDIIIPSSCIIDQISLFCSIFSDNKNQPSYSSQEIKIVNTQPINSKQSQQSQTPQAAICSLLHNFVYKQLIANLHMNLVKLLNRSSQALLITKQMKTHFDNQSTEIIIKSYSGIINSFALLFHRLSRIPQKKLSLIYSDYYQSPEQIRNTIQQQLAQQQDPQSKELFPLYYLLQSLFHIPQPLLSISIFYCLMSLSSFNEDNYAYKSFNAIVSFASVVSIPASSLQSQDETQLAQLGTISSSRDKHQQSNSEYNQLIWYKTLIELCNLGCDAKTILSSLHSECISPLICAFLHLLLLRQEQKEYETIPQQISVILGQLGINHTNIVSIGQIQPNSNSCVNLPFKQLALSTLRFIGGCPDILMKDAAESLVNLIRFQIPQIYRANDFGQQAIIEAISLSPNESIRVLVENPTFLTLFEEKNILRLVRLLIDFAKQWRK